MQKINFQNLPNTTTPVSASNLNTLQDNVENAINGLNVGQYAYIKIPTTQSVSTTAYQFQNMPFSNSPYFASNTNLFEATSSGIKCKFSGTLLIFTTIAVSESNEIDVKIGTRTITTTGSRQNYGMCFIAVSENDIVPLNFAFGASTTLSVYDASILLFRLT